jgi:hypothetical protein
MLKVRVGARGYARSGVMDNDLTGTFPPELFELQALTCW